MRNVILLLSLLLFSLKGISQSKTDYSSVVESYNAKLEKITSSGNIKGLSVALIDGNEIVWSENYGYSDYENKIRTNSNTLYGIGAGVNLFTSTAIMQLHDRKKIDLYDSVLNYCPDFKVKQRNGIDEKITVMNLLCHRSGLPSDLAINRYLKNKLSTKSMKEILSKEYAPYSPNSIFMYSDIGYYLLADIMENVSDSSYKDYVESNIFTPLGLNSTCFSCDDSLRLSKGYDRDNALRYDINMSPESQDNMVLSNIDDMAKFTMSFLPAYKGKKILKKQSIRKMLTCESEESSLDLNKKYAITWKYERINAAGQIYYHVSKSLNHRCLYAVAPETNLAVVFLSNSVNCGKLHNVTMNLLDACARLKGKSHDKSREGKLTSLSDTTIIKAETLAKYAGYYANSSFVFKVSKDKNQLNTMIDGNKFILKPITDESFLAQIVLPDNKTQLINFFKFKYLPYENTKVLYVQNLNNGQNDVLGVKITPKTITSHWKDRLGYYELYDTDKSRFVNLPTFELVEENGVLVFKIDETSNKRNIALSVKDDNTAFTIGLGSQIGHTLLFEQENGKEILWYSGLKLMHRDN